jgi:hypothetical protein
VGFESGARLNALLARADRAGMLLTEHRTDPATGDVIVRRTQDVEPYLDRNKELAWSDGARGYNADKSRRHVAEIPLIVVEQWLREGINVLKPEDWPKVRKRLNDPEYRHLRVSGGRI